MDSYNVVYNLSMPRKQSNPQTPVRFSQPLTPALDRLSAYKRRVLPWTFLACDEWENGLTFLSGDKAYEAVLYMDGPRRRALVTRLYVDRRGRQAYEGYEPSRWTYVSEALGQRLNALFSEWTTERLSQQGHLYWGRHSEFCRRNCDYMVLPVDEAARDAARNKAWGG